MLPQNNPDRITSYPELFPEDFGERLEKLVEFAGLSPFVTSDSAQGRSLSWV